MINATRCRANTPGVIHEIIEGEAVLVNLDTGVYYSADKSGALAWSLLSAGATLAEAAQRLAERYTAASQAEIEAALEPFLEQLLKEGLLAADPSSTGALPDLPPADGAGQPFEAPLLHKYTDMEDLLLLDSVHEVDETGWPSEAGGGSGGTGGV